MYSDVRGELPWLWGKLILNLSPQKQRLVPGQKFVGFLIWENSRGGRKWILTLKIEESKLRFALKKTCKDS